MADSINHGEANSRSASDRSISDTDQKKRISGSTTSSKASHNQEDSTTPTAKPPSGSQSQATMGPPPRPNFKATPTSAQPSKMTSQASSQETSQEDSLVSKELSRNDDHQPAAPSKHPTNDTVHATPRKRNHVEVDQEPTTHGQESSDEDAEPADQIASFDWMELQNRYHHQMGQYRAQEHDLYNSFHDLCGVNNIFACFSVALLTNVVLLRLGRDRTRPRGQSKLQTVPLVSEALESDQDTDMSLA